MSSWQELSEICDEYGWDADDTLEALQRDFADGEDFVAFDDGRCLVRDTSVEALCDLVRGGSGTEDAPVAEEEVYTGEEAASRLGLNGADSLRATISRARAAGCELPGVKVILSGSPGRPPHGYTGEFVAAMARFMSGRGGTLPTTASAKIDARLSVPASEVLRALRATDAAVALLDLSDLLDAPPRHCRAALEELQEHGYDVRVDGGHVVLSTAGTPAPRVAAPEWGRDRCRIGVVSDLHLGSLQSKLHSLQMAYDTFEREHCLFAINLGDVFHGPSSMHKGYEFELMLHGLEEQIEFAVAHYPDNLTTYFIDGNHDTAWHKQSGMYPAKQLCLHNPARWLWCGALEGMLAGPDGDPGFIGLYHPADASMRDLSLKGRRLAEFQTFSRGRVPAITMYGHYHKFNLQCGPQGSYVLQVPASCDLTGWMQSRSITNVMGALILEFSVIDGSRIADLAVRHLSYRSCGNEINYGTLSAPRESTVVTPEWKERICA